jgi:flagellar basal-body rod protein FlgB
MTMNEIKTTRGLLDSTFGLLQKSLDLRTSRHEVLSANIANAETPGYVARDIPFEKVLARAVQPASVVNLYRTHASHLGGNPANVLAVETVAEGGNIDQQMARLAENNIRFQADIQALMKKLESLKLALSETR